MEKNRFYDNLRSQKKKIAVYHLWPDARFAIFIGSQFRLSRGVISRGLKINFAPRTSQWPQNYRKSAQHNSRAAQSSKPKLMIELPWPFSARRLTIVAVAAIRKALRGPFFYQQTTSRSLRNQRVPIIG